MATTTVPSASVQAKAAVLISERERWAYVRNARTGRSFIAMPSSDGQHVYYVARDGSACTCKAAQNGLMCSHRLAAAEAANHDALDAWLADMAVSVALKADDSAAIVADEAGDGLASEVTIEAAFAGVRADHDARRSARRSRYDELFPACRYPGCDENALRSGYCLEHR